MRQVDMAPDPEDERMPLERIRMILVRSEAVRVSQARPDIANDIPLLYAPAVAAFVDRVVAVLQVRAVEHHESHEQSLVRPAADEGVLFPAPWPQLLEAFLLEPEPAAGFRVGAPVVLEGEGGQIVHGRLVIPDRRKDAREHDFHWPFVFETTGKRLLHAPLTPLWIDDRQARVDTGMLPLHERVDSVRIRSASGSPVTVVQIPGRNLRRLPPDRHVGTRGHGRKNRRLRARDARNQVQRCHHRGGHEKDSTSHVLILPAAYGTNGAAAARRVSRESSSGSVNLTTSRQPSSPRAASKRANVCRSVCRRRPTPYERLSRFKSPSRAATFPASTKTAASRCAVIARRPSAFITTRLRS